VTLLTLSIYSAFINIDAVDESVDGELVFDELDQIIFVVTGPTYSRNIKLIT